MKEKEEKTTCWPAALVTDGLAAGNKEIELDALFCERHIICRNLTANLKYNLFFVGCYSSCKETVELKPTSQNHNSFDIGHNSALLRRILRGNRFVGQTSKLVSWPLLTLAWNLVKRAQSIRTMAYSQHNPLLGWNGVVGLTNDMTVDGALRG